MQILVVICLMDYITLGIDFSNFQTESIDNLKKKYNNTPILFIFVWYINLIERIAI